MESLIVILFQFSSAMAKNPKSGVRFGPPILDKTKVDKKKCHGHLNNTNMFPPLPLAQCC